ncbi:MAG: hypothetical protein A4E60_03570 [Syntrophorhabdus sp. PtaB.Bin047]|nr:MAG: hypothetical protein A4E60_03570 [Syntrophorhabdus sp. PtaB.Bin047]
MRTLPREYFVFFEVTASSMASLIAIPRLPGWSGFPSRNVRPAFVSGLGLGTHFPPQVSIITRRYGFWLKLTRTM